MKLNRGEVLTKANILTESINFSSEPSGLATPVSVFHSEDVIKKKDIHLWDKGMGSSEHCLRELLPPTRNRTNLRNRGHNFILHHAC